MEESQIMLLAINEESDADKCFVSRHRKTMKDRGLIKHFRVFQKDIRGTVFNDPNLNILEQFAAMRQPIDDPYPQPFQVVREKE